MIDLFVGDKYEGWRKGVTTFISADRAKQVIRDGNTSFGEYQKYLTNYEIAEVKRLWALNPNGSSSFYSTLNRISQECFEYDKDRDDYLSLKYEIAHDDIQHDPWGTAFGWLFAICEEINYNRDIEVPDEWAYSPSIIGTEPEEGFAADCVKDVGDETLVRVGNLLHRYLGFVKRAGRDY